MASAGSGQFTPRRKTRKLLCKFRDRRFYDHNPAAEPQSGGPVNLWTALFGVTDFVEIILGMEAWVKDGSLPDGSRGLAITAPVRNRSKSTKVKLATETLVARDDF
jgi:hypothetical protein